jgi:DNA-binding response OmpR family regulator
MKQELKKHKVLIADDDVTTRLLLRASITQWNFSVVEANDGEEAFELLQAEDPPRILIVDWMMPNLDGIGLCTRLNNSSQKRPYIILLTHNKGTANLVKAIESGADEFIAKPINLEELRCRLIVGLRIIMNEYAAANDKFPFSNTKISNNSSL